MTTFYEPSSILGAPNAEFISPGDFSVAYTSEQTLTLSGAPAVADNSELVYVMVVPATGQAKMYINGIGGVALRLAGAVLTLQGVPRPFTAGDKYRMGIGAKQSVVLHGDINVDSTSVDTSGLSGKVSGGDFDTAYSAVTDIACTNMPTYHPTLLSDDIVTIFQINASGVVVKTYSRDDMPMTVAGNVITVTGATFGATDTFVVYTNIERYFDSINLEMVDGANVDVGAGNAGAGTQRVTLADDDVNTAAIKTASEALNGALKSVDTDEVVTRVTDSAGAEINPAKEDGNLADILAALLAQLSSAEATHISPTDFTATFTSSSTITLSGIPSGLVSGIQVTHIKQKKADNTYNMFVNCKNCSIDFTAGVLTIYNAGTPFVTGDEYEVGLRLQDKATDASQDVIKMSEQSPQKDWRTGAIPLVTEQDLTLTEDDFGSLIDVEDVKFLTLYIAADVNDSLDVDLSAYTIPASGGDEYTSQDAGSTTSISLWTATVLDFFHEYIIPTAGHAFIQLKGIAGSNTGTFGDLTILIRKEY